MPHVLALIALYVTEVLLALVIMLTIAFRRTVPLVCCFRMSLARTRLPLHVLFLLHVVVQCDGLV